MCRFRPRRAILPPLARALAMLPGIAAAPPPAGADGAPAQVVELFQSRDCPACPAARTNLDALAHRARVLALSYPVSFRAPADWAAAGARAEFMRRQRDYVAATGAGEVATPQMILNGRLLLGGGDAGEVAVVLARATALEAAPQLAALPGAVQVSGAAPRRPLDVWLVEYSPRVAGTASAAETGVHRNLVRGLRRLARWSGGTARLELPPLAPGRRAAVLLQHADMGAIVAALEIAG